MVRKGKEDKGKEDKEKNYETNAEAYNKEEKKVDEDKDADEDTDMDNEQNAMDTVPWMENMEEHIKHDGKIKQD